MRQLTSLLLASLLAGCGDDAPVVVPPDLTVGPDLATCPGRQIKCGDACVDPLVDRANCGGCAKACAAGEVCSMGACAVSCQMGLTSCGGLCSNTKTDVENCGSCGVKCEAGKVCSSGACATSCQAGLTECGGSCVNTRADNQNCGACGSACKAGEVCSMGACALSCQAGLTDCGGLCVSTKTDVENCGGCGKKCEAGRFCSAGACTISCVGLSVCGTACTDLQNDPANCGACGTKCKTGEICAKGACDLLCSGGTTRCGAACVNVKADVENCGACGKKCDAGLACVAGACDLVCAGGTTRCGAACVSLKTDGANCGACDKKCPGGQSCSDGNCCPAGQSFCGGACRDVLTDGANCGACGVKCDAGKTCYAGSCTTIVQTCNAIKQANPASTDGLFLIDPDLAGSAAPIKVYCDMTTDGGGWTLVSYGYRQAGNAEPFYLPNADQGVWDPGKREGFAAINAQPMVAASTYAMLSTTDNVLVNGNLAAYAQAFKWAIPNPASARFTLDDPVGGCTSVTVTEVKSAWTFSAYVVASKPMQISCSGHKNGTPYERQFLGFNSQLCYGVCGSDPVTSMGMVVWKGLVWNSSSGGKGNPERPASFGFWLK